MNTPRPTRLTTAQRVACSLVSAFVTALIFSAQFGLAIAYGESAEAILAARQTQPPVAQQATPIVQPQS